MNPVFSNSDYDRLRAALSVANTDQNASEVHGIICGAICNQLNCGRRLDVNSLVSTVAGVDAESKHALEASIDSLYESSQQSLEDRDSSFSLMLPSDERDLAERTESVALWCRGFVFGFLYNQSDNMDRLPGHAAEITRDFIAISQAEPGEDTQQDEWALADIEEYVRVGVQLIYEELQSDADSARVQ